MRTGRQLQLNYSCWAFIACSFLLAVLPNSVAATEVDGTCSRSLNIGLDYFLGTKLFSNLTKVDLPAEIPLPLRGIKIVRLRLQGLDRVARGCSLELSSPGAGQLRVKACARAERIMASFVLKALNYPVDFASAALADTSVSFQATVQAIPGGRIQLEAFDVQLGSIEVENTGVTGAIITKLMKMSIIKERVRSAIVTQGGNKIKEVLMTVKLPE